MKKGLGIVLAALSTLVISNLAFADYYLCRGGVGNDEMIVRFDTCARTAHVDKAGPLPAYSLLCMGSSAAGVLLQCEGQGGRTLFFYQDGHAEYIGARETTQLSCENTGSGNHNWGIQPACVGE